MINRAEISTREKLGLGWTEIPEIFSLPELNPTQISKISSILTQFFSGRNVCNRVIIKVNKTKYYHNYRHN